MTGGAAFVSKEKLTISFTGITIGNDSTRVGWTVGAGLDYALTNNWFTGLEYRYSQYDIKSLPPHPNAIDAPVPIRLGPRHAPPDEA